MKKKVEATQTEESAQTEETTQKTAERHYTKHTKEQREFNSAITEDYFNIFKSKYINFFDSFSKNYNGFTHIDKNVWEQIYEFVKEITPIVENYSLIADTKKLEKLKYIEVPSNLYMVREKLRLNSIKQNIEEYHLAENAELKTDIQKWNNKNRLGRAIMLIYLHMYLYLTETTK